MAPLIDAVRSTISYIHFYLFSILPHALGMAFYAVLPQKLYKRLTFFLSSQHQLLNLSFGRLLPNLTFPNTSLSGKIAIVTGANSGIGYQLALSLARLGAKVHLAVRSESKGQDAVISIVSTVPSAKGRLNHSILDTSSLSSVRAFAATYEAQGWGQIDILCHNAGITHPPSRLTTESIETIYATNFLGSFLLTHLLEPHLAPNARVVFTSSTGQLNASFTSDFSTQTVRGTIEPGFHAACFTVPVLGWRVWSPSESSKYSQTKAMQCAFARMLQRRWDVSAELNDQAESQRRRMAHAFTPGFTMTPIFGKFQSGKSFLLDLLRDPIFTLLAVTTFAATDVSQGAMTGVWLAAAREKEIAEADTAGIEIGGGGYWDRMHQETSIADIMSDSMLNRLWKRWEADAGIEWKS